jgi:hypothetical protein
LHNAIPPKVAEIDCIIDCELRDELVADNTYETLDHSFSGIGPYSELIRREIQDLIFCLRLVLFEDLRYFEDRLLLQAEDCLSGALVIDEVLGH